MEDNNNYTYTYRKEKKKEIQRVRIIIISIYAVLVILCIVFGVLFGHRAAVKAREEELSSQQAEQEASSTEEITTADPSPYKPGDYAVNTEGYSLKFRKEHNTGSDVYLEISDGTKLTIEEIYHDETAVSSGSDIDYWGKTTYKGYTGWVAMNYLKKAYSDNIITPEDLTEESTTQAPESTTQTPESTTQTESTTQPSTEPSTEPSSQGSASTEASTEESTTAARYTAGDYVVSTGGYTLTFRKTASKDGETILSIEDGTKLIVTKIIDTNDANDATRYWGEVTYKGHTGYVSMAYLKRAS